MRSVRSVRVVRFAACVALGILLAPGMAPAVAQAETTGQLQIEAKPIPGQLDVLQGTAFQLGGTPPDKGPRPSSYSWEIVEGEGGKILKADQPEAIFQAPTLEDKSMELFMIQLTAAYRGKPPATAQLHVRVHRELPAKTAEQEKSEKEIVDRYQRMSKKERKKLAKQYKKQQHSRTTVARTSPYPSWHFGYSYGWGWPINYPVYVPIIVPPPGGEWSPGEGEWVEPAPLPYDQIVNDFPRDVADNYLPQDFPLADEYPGGGGFGDGPGDFYEPSFGGGYGGGYDDPGFGGGYGGGMDDFGGGMDDFGGGGFDDFGGGFDDFGW